MERREERAAAAADKPVREASAKAEPARRRRRAFRRGAGYAAVVAVFTALLLAAQYALWFVKGVELVTVLLLVFSYRFGVRCGVLSAVAFSLLRCLLFGFFPNVVLLYLLYYPLFAACFGLLGNALYRRTGVRVQMLLTCSPFCSQRSSRSSTMPSRPFCTAIRRKRRSPTSLASLPTMAVQTVCAAVTVLLLFRPLLFILKRVKL